MAPCTYCGFCERFGCGNYSKASPQTSVLPALMREPNFEARTDMRGDQGQSRRRTARRATGVTYVDVNGEECEQPADLVLVCAYALHNVRLLLLSGIGKPYDPATGEGVVGRNYAYQTGSGVDGLLRGQVQSVHRRRRARRMRSTTSTATISTTARMASSAAAIDHLRLHQRPADPVPPDAARARRHGAAKWKKAVSETYQRVTSVGAHGSVMSYRNNYLDLDPTYKDPLGRPLMRMTFDYHDNERKMSN